nr:FAD-dependent oxidoreductase [uncultured Cohaesibacter sp.]
MSEIIVLGAGMVGVSTALALQERGHAVTLLDRTNPGLETSYGNAGLIQREAAEPYHIPHNLVTLFLYGIGRTNDIVYHWKDMPNIMPSLWTYFVNSGETQHRRISKIFEQMTVKCTDDHQPLIEASGTERLIERKGFFKLCRNKRSYDDQSIDAERIASMYDVPLRMVDGKELRQLEPALKIDVAGAVHWTDTWACSDPGALTSAYADLFIKRGGTFVKGDAMTLKQTETGWEVQSDDGPVTGSDVVVALGPWAPDLLGPFGYKIKMVYKRGYHAHFKMDNPLSRPIQDYANGCVFSPMDKGMRIATGAELVNRKDPANPKQLMHGLKSARELMDVGEMVEDEPWFGNRPCMPDMLPIVGPAQKHKGLWFHFGHGHQGFTQGPTTAKLLVDVMEGKTSTLSDALSPENRPVISAR